MTVNDRIRERRIELEMTQEELAAKMGYTSRSVVAQYENNREMTLKKVKEFAAALNCSASYLLGWEDMEGRALNYEQAMNDYPNLKELNSIIKAHYEDCGFLDKLLDYAKLLIK